MSDTQAPCTVFVVDDSEPDRYLARYELEDACPSMEVVECVDGPALLSELRRPHWRAVDRCIGILLDINMPSLTGFDVLDEISSEPELQHWVSQMCIFVMLSSSNNDGDRAKAQSYDFDVGYFTKPLDVDNVGLLLQQLGSCTKNCESVAP